MRTAERPRAQGAAPCSRIRTGLLTVAFVCTWLLAIGPARADSSPYDAQQLERELVFLEAGWGLSQGPSDAYTRRLEQFGFQTAPLSQSALSLVGATSLGVMLTRSLGVLARYEGLERNTYERDLSGYDTFEWSTRAVSLGLRVRLPLAGEWFAAYGETTAGLGFAGTRTSIKSEQDRERFWGPSIGARIGILGHATRHLGFFAEGGYTYAPVIENLLGETHNDGGISFITGIRVRLMGGGS